MADYREKRLRGSIGLLGTPALATRVDSPADLAGADGQIAQMQFDSAGNLRMTEQGGRLTYDSAIGGLVAAATCTDLFEIAGSATKIVWVEEIRLSGVATAAIGQEVHLIRRSTANTSGTATTPALVPRKTGDAAATAVVKAYTANPTTGTPVGTIRVARYLVVAVATGIPDQLVFDLRGRNGGRGVRLSGVAEGLMVNLNAGSPGAGNLFAISCTLVEGPTTE